ncbi:Do family serine endopeptidase [Acidobacteriota bacterium]
MKTLVIRLFTLGFLVSIGVIIGFVLSSSTDNTSPLSATPSPPAPAIVGNQLALPNIADIAEQLNPAVVSITSTDIRKSRPNNFFDFWFNPYQRPRPEEDEEKYEEQRSGGSGFVISSDGYILTNHHVIDDADKVEVDLSSGEKLKAKVVGSDPDTDIALIKIEKSGLSSIVLGDSDKLRVGEWVIAIGNPWAYDHTVTVGVVSAKGRSLGSSSFDDFIQTDAAINFGNSGGPLLNLDGEVVGINTAISARGQNIGFAIPINMATRILDQLKDSGHVVRGYLGVHIRDIGPEMQEALELPDRNGSLVSEVVKGFGAEEAGIKRGDVIVEVNGKSIESNRELIHTISGFPPREKVKLKVLRKGKLKNITVTLSERPPESQASVAPRQEPEDEEGAEKLLGVQVKNLSSRLRSQYRISDRYNGVVVVDVERLGNAWNAGIRGGDLISEVEQNEVTDVEGFLDEIEKSRKKKKDLILLYVVRSDRGNYVAVRIEEKPEQE